MELRLKDIAHILDGTIDGDEDTVISNISGIEDAKEGDITFVANPKYIKYIEQTNASAIVCSPDISSESKNLLKVKNPYLAYAKAITFLNPPREETGTVDERAFIGRMLSLEKMLPYIHLLSLVTDPPSETTQQYILTVFWAERLKSDAIPSFTRMLLSERNVLSAIMSLLIQAQS